MQILHSWVNLHLIRTMCKLNFAYIEFCSNIKEVSSPPTFRWRHYKKIAMATSFLTCNVFGAVAKHFPTFHKILRNFSSFLKKNPHTTAVSFVFTDIKYDSVLQNLVLYPTILVRKYPFSVKIHVWIAKRSIFVFGISIWGFTFSTQIIWTLSKLTFTSESNSCVNLHTLANFRRMNVVYEVLGKICYKHVDDL